MVDQPVLTPRYAVVSPFMAQWLLRQAAVDSRKLRESAAMLTSVGRPDWAEQLVDGARQLSLSAEEHRATVKGAGSDVGTAVGLPTLDRPEKIRFPSPGPFAYAAIARIPITS